MRDTYWGYWLIILGIAIISLMMLINKTTTTSNEDYYLLKEITQAAMIDAVDYAYYRQYSELRIHKEKFVESFTRRFAETISLKNDYTIEFYDIYEAPPKVSVLVTSNSGVYNFFTYDSVNGDDGNTDVEITQKIDAILEVGYN